MYFDQFVMSQMYYVVACGMVRDKNTMMPLSGVCVHAENGFSSVS